MSFGIGRGVAEVQILKKWKEPYLLNWVEYSKKKKKKKKKMRKHWH